VNFFTINSELLVVVIIVSEGFAPLVLLPSIQEPCETECGSNRFVFVIRQREGVTSRRPDWSRYEDS